METSDFLDIAPDNAGEQFQIGDKAVEIRGLSLIELANISRRYPAFLRVVEGQGGSLLQAGEALPAVVAAGLGHFGDEEYERQAERFRTNTIMGLATAIMGLTFTRPAKGDDAGNQPVPGAGNGLAAPAAETENEAGTGSPQLSSK